MTYSFAPLTPDQLQEISDHARAISQCVAEISHLPIPIVVQSEAEVNQLTLNVGEWRQKVAKLDMVLFRTWHLVGRLRNSNVPTSLPPPKERPTTETLLEMLK